MSTKKTRPEQDPYAEREAEKYARPVPSREFILQTLSEADRLLTRREIAEHFGLTDEDELEGLRRRLRAMERDGQLICNRRGGYGVVKKMDLIRGRVIGHPDGFGFLVPDEGGDDLFISAKRMRGLLHGDRVVVQVVGKDHRGRLEAAPVEVLERANHRVVGRFHVEHGIAFVEASNQRISQDILIPPEAHGGAREGQIVVAEIVEQPTARSRPIGRVVEVLGDHMAPGMEIDIAIRAHELPAEWPTGVVREAARVPAEVAPQAYRNREDLRELPLVTIDGEDSRDFDDAVYVERHGRGWRLLVAIADVAHYVKPDSALDQEAFKRGNSVYFPGRVIPMLPEVLSNGLCSINPDVDRLCLVCELKIGANGVTRSYRFFEGVMRSHARLTYGEVAAMLEGDDKLRRRYDALVPHLETAHDLYRALAERRKKRGAIDFETTETRIIFGEDKKIERIVPVVRNDAHRLIEEFMIAANVAAAEFLLKHEIPALYRVHKGPADEKFAALLDFLKSMGLKFGNRNKQPEPRHYARLLEEIRERPDARLIQTVLLRSLSQAVYTPENCGHFGLAFDAYTHFTSPIRRYPDLIVHRAIKHLVRGKPVEKYIYDEETMSHMGEHCSMTERRADEATRDVVDWLKCEYLMDKVGEEFDGIISAVTSFGLFVELNDMFVEGLIHITALDNDYYHFDAVHHRLTGERSGRSFRLADPIRVKVVRVDLDERKVDFEWVGGDERSQDAHKPARRQGKKTSGRAGRKTKGRRRTRKKSSKSGE